MRLIGGKNAKKKSSSSSTTKRHFTVVIGSKEHGLYVSSSPSSAARKAVSKLCATDKKRKVQFSIREITQGSKKKTYGPYLGYIEKLTEPIELKGRVIKYKPVAKLSGKTGAKKGGMRGGNCVKILNNIKNKKIAEELKKDIDNLIPGDLVATIRKSNNESNNKYELRIYTEVFFNATPEKLRGIKETVDEYLKNILRETPNSFKMINGNKSWKNSPL